MGWIPKSLPDADAIHDNVAGEIAAVTEKSTPVSADLVLIEDSADSNAKKKVQVGNLPGGGGGGGSDRGVRVRRSTNQTISDSTRTAISFDTETRDDGGFWEGVTNPTRVTIPTGEDGWYTIAGGVRWVNTSGGIRQAEIRINGSTLITIDSNPSPPSAVNVYNDVTCSYYLAATDYVELTVFQSSGGDLAVQASAEFTPFLSVVRSGVN